MGRCRLLSAFGFFGSGDRIGSHDREIVFISSGQENGVVGEGHVPNVTKRPEVRKVERGPGLVHEIAGSHGVVDLEDPEGPGADRVEEEKLGRSSGREKETAGKDRAVR